MKEHQVSYDIFTPFGPRVLKSSVPQTVVDAINLRADEIPVSYTHLRAHET